MNDTQHSVCIDFPVSFSFFYVQVSSESQILMFGHTVILQRRQEFKMAVFGNICIYSTVWKHLHIQHGAQLIDGSLGTHLPISHTRAVRLKGRKFWYTCTGLFLAEYCLRIAILGTYMPDSHVRAARLNGHNLCPFLKGHCWILQCFHITVYYMVW